MRAIVSRPSFPVAPSRRCAGGRGSAGAPPARPELTQVLAVADPWDGSRARWEM